MSVRVSSWAWKQPLRGTRKLVLLALADEANDVGVSYPGQKRLAGKCGVTPRRLRDHLEALEDGDYLERESRRRPNGSRSSDLYRLVVPRERES